MIYSPRLKPLQSYKSLRRAAAVAATFTTLSLASTFPALAEGSKELIFSGGDRPFLEWSTETTANIPRKTLLKVYVKAGETLNLGSSNATSFDAQDIVYRTPSGTTSVCDVRDGNDATNPNYGWIDTLAKEDAGPLPNNGGYVPCQVLATTTGIYEVEFHGPTSGNANNNPPATLATSQFPTTGTFHTVAAWDITVRDSSGDVKPGRVFTNYVAINLGGSNRSLNADLFVQTWDGFLYINFMNGLDPYGFLFFANSRGFIDRTTGNTLYRSTGISAQSNLSTFPGNIEVQRPDVPNTSTDKTHLVFINQPDVETLTFLGIPSSPVTPPLPNDFRFTGLNSSDNQTPVTVGGNFSFNVSADTSYEIIIDTNNDGVYNPAVDRILRNPAPAGSNTVFWDGKDAGGVDLQPLPNGAAYNARITTRGGEYHFPMLDAENNPNGFYVEILNEPGNPTIALRDTPLYYDDRNYTAGNGTAINLDSPGTPSQQREILAGTLSKNTHEYTGGYGDLRGMDNWTFYSGSTATTGVVIITPQVRVAGTKGVSFSQDVNGDGQVNVGDRVIYTITYTNPLLQLPAQNFQISDTLPPQVQFVSASITSQTPGNTLTLNPNYNGSGALTNAGQLRPGDSITLTITAEITRSNGGNPISNQASARFTTPTIPNTTFTVLTDATSQGATSNTPPAVGQPFFQSGDTQNTGNDPNLGDDDDPTLFQVQFVPPRLRLVKRITQVNGVNLTGFEEDPNSTDDNAPNWPAGYLAGRINAQVRPNQEVEYTIYFLSDGGQPALGVQMCDRLPADQVFVPDAYGQGQGIQLAIGNSLTALTNSFDGDRGDFFPAPTTPPINCPPKALPTDPDNPDGAVLIRGGNALDLPRATAPGTAGTYGYFRFKALVR